MVRGSRGSSEGFLGHKSSDWEGGSTGEVAPPADFSVWWERVPTTGSRVQGRGILCADFLLALRARRLSLCTLQCRPDFLIFMSPYCAPHPSVSHDSPTCSLHWNFTPESSQGPYTFPQLPCSSGICFKIITDLEVSVRCPRGEYRERREVWGKIFGMIKSQRPSPSTTAGAHVSWRTSQGFYFYIIFFFFFSCTL